jgi:hypothetical protein
MALSRSEICAGDQRQSYRTMMSQQLNAAITCGLHTNVLSFPLVPQDLLSLCQR